MGITGAWARVSCLLISLASLGYLVRAMCVATGPPLEELAFLLLLFPANLSRLGIVSGRPSRPRAVLWGVSPLLELLALVGLREPVPLWAWLAAWGCAALHVATWGRKRLSALAATPGVLAVSLGEASCVTAVLSFTLFNMVAIVLARTLNGSLVEPSPMIRGLGFLSAWFATLASLLLTLPAPHWLGTATPGRHAALLLLALVASAGVTITLGMRSPDPAVADASALT